MATTLLESTRQMHEDMERLERLIVKDLRTETKTHKDKLLQSHRIRGMLDAIQDRANSLVEAYTDEDESRKREIAALRGPDPLATFYNRLRDVREYHRKFPSDEITQGDASEALLAAAERVPAFSGEEALGRCLDLHELYAEHGNGGFVPTEDYHSYVVRLAEWGRVPRPRRTSVAYRAYLSKLEAYLSGFLSRVQPLSDADAVVGAAQREFDEAWEAGTVPGWEDRGAGPDPGAVSAGGVATPGAPLALPAPGDAEELDLSSFDSAEELELLGGDRLKSALRALGLKIGGTPAQRAARLWATKGRAASEYDPGSFAGGGGARGKREAAARETAGLEARIARLLGALGGVQAATADRVEKRGTQTYEEMLAEQVEAEEEGDLGGPGSDEEDAPVYNPLKLPLGWDGRPIPFWLYRLHGLNIEFKCEICGGASYWGRRAYERHFKEAQHQQGLRALGVPWSREFYEVTGISDALALWKSMRERRGGEGPAGPGVEEEFEDADGNVYNKKTWMDLKRQGLV